MKHNFLFFTAALRRPYSAKSWGYPDESAQMLFDLLKKIPILRRVGSIGKRIERNVATIRSGRNARRERRFRAAGRLRRYGTRSRSDAWLGRAGIDGRKQENAGDQLTFALSVTTGALTKLCNTATAASTLATFLMRM